MGSGQRHAEFASGEQHDDPFGFHALGEIFRMPGKCHAAAADKRLIDRRRNHGLKDAVDASIGSPVQRGQNACRILRGPDAGDGGDG